MFYTQILQHLLFSQHRKVIFNTVFRCGCIGIRNLMCNFGGCTKIIFAYSSMNLERLHAMKKIFILMIWAGGLIVTAQPPAGYYSAALGKSGATLKTTLHEIISHNFVSRSYAELWTIFQTSDVLPNGRVWDMYSNCTWTFTTNQCGNYSRVCDCYNREHSIPASWFNDRYPMYSDAFHLYPTDGRVNGQRGNHPFGETAFGTTLTNGKGRLGASTFAGYSQTVFEPVDEYKGDFARTYFYFATRYENIMVSGINGASFNNTTYPSFSNWSREMFLKWHRNDPVSQKEITRNNVIFGFQQNRNPFIDHPEMVEHVWGQLVNSPWILASIRSYQKAEIGFSHQPEKRTLTIHSPFPAHYRILNISGQTVKSGRINENENVLGVDLRAGMYLFRLESEHVQHVFKFVVQ